MLLIVLHAWCISMFIIFRIYLNYVHISYENPSNEIWVGLKLFVVWTASFPALICISAVSFSDNSQTPAIFFFSMGSDAHSIKTVLKSDPPMIEKWNTHLKAMNHTFYLNEGTSLPTLLVFSTSLLCLFLNSLNNMEIKKSVFFAPTTHQGRSYFSIFSRKSYWKWFLHVLKEKRQNTMYLLHCCLIEIFYNACLATKDKKQ